MKDRKFNSYRQYLEKLLGYKAQKVAVNVDMQCPNRDGKISTGGCTFCINEAFTPSYCNPQKSPTQQIQEGIDFHKHRYAKTAKYLAYFQSYSNTYAPAETLRKLYTQATEHPEVVGLVIGTRPDCIDQQKLDLLQQLAHELDYLIVEYGVESVYDQTLSRINRGHDFRCAQEAIEQTAQRGIHTGAHFILGLPGESKQMMLQAIDQINQLPLNTIKFHQLQIFRGTAMADDYSANLADFVDFSMDEYLDFFCEVLERLRPDLVVERFVSEAPAHFHLHGSSPWGRVRNERLVQLLEQRLDERQTHQGRLFRG